MDTKQLFFCALALGAGVSLCLGQLATETPEAVVEAGVQAEAELEAVDPSFVGDADDAAGGKTAADALLVSEPDPENSIRSMDRATPTEAPVEVDSVVVLSVPAGDEIAEADSELAAASDPAVEPVSTEKEPSLPDPVLGEAALEMMTQALSLRRRSLRLRTLRSMCALRRTLHLSHGGSAIRSAREM